MLRESWEGNGQGEAGGWWMESREKGIKWTRMETY